MNRAFTLLETVITVAFAAAIMLAIANLYINFNTLYIHQQTFTATTNAATAAMSAISAAVTPADSVVFSHTFSGTGVSTGANALVLELPTVNAAGAIVPNAHDYVGFYLTGTDLYRAIDADALSARVSGTKRIAPLVALMSFAYDTADATLATTVFATTTTQLVTQRSGTVQTTLHGQSYLRNK